MGGSVKKANTKRKTTSCRQAIKRAKKAGPAAVVTLGAGTDGAAGEHRIKPRFKSSDGLKVIQGSDNAAVIVMDNNPEKASGGGDFASRISIVAGLAGHKLTEDKVYDDVRNLKHDAAGVYLVQKGDPQKIFNAPLANPALYGLKKVSEDDNFDDENKSHVTAFADTIQLVARDGGINLYAGGVDTHLASGVPQGGTSLGVNLIGGNRVEYGEVTPDTPKDKALYSLQPLVKANNLQMALDTIIERIDDLNNAVFELQLQSNINAVKLAFHTHITTGSPVTQIAWPSIELISSTAAEIPMRVKSILSSITGQINLVSAEINKSSISTTGIASAFNKTN